ncbi:SET domain-containing protein [Setomelanomma holmii]|uniref:SET domain-containing protein n=1 Tax=Setomelanomma holmii TaxID=210430 RepID=A0A9P4HP14_9PLEO|nr:SET domain-containing protein [Setomelanomma holmii]
MSSVERQPNHAVAHSACSVSAEAFSPHALAEELVKWFTENGGQLSDDVELAFDDSRGFHIRATRPLCSPVVVTCPLKLTLSCLSLDPVQQEVLHIDSPLQQCRGKIPDHILTHLLLIDQRLKGRDSPWHAYIACLPGPESMTTPLWFDDDDMTFLAGTGLPPAIKEREAEYHEQWQNALEILKEIGAPLADELDHQSFLWAATICTSRAFISTHILPDHDTFPVLFPVVDILNHSAEAQIEWAFEPHQSFSLKLLDGKTTCPGQELLNNYAPKQNDELLLGYGFCLEDHAIEQFSLKLAFPPAWRQFAADAGLFKPENIPFGMSTDFLNGDPDHEQHFLRAPGHPFGRYDSCIPFFRGIPPYIVHFFFIQSLLTLDIDIRQLKIARPGARVTLQVLILLHQAISQRCSNLPLTLPRQPTNVKQTFAKIYRDGQAKIIHSIRIELRSVIARLRAPFAQVPPARPALLSPTEALLTSAAELPLFESQRFKEGLDKHDLHSLADDRMVWTLWLICVGTYQLTNLLGPDSLIHDWLRTIYTQHPLSQLEEGIEDADTYSFVDGHLADFLDVPGHEDEREISEALDSIGEKFRSMDANKEPVLVMGPVENLGARIIMWGMKVVDAEMVNVMDENGQRACLYVKPWKQDDDGSDESWMYEETVVV